MSEQITIDAENFIAFRQTPWDTKSLGINTTEITKIVSNDAAKANALIKEFDAYNVKNNVKLCYSRINAEDIILKRALIQNNFYQAEISFEIFKNNIHNYNLKLPKVELFRLDENDAENILAIKNIAKDSFDFSRFHDDVNIEIDKARNRYFNWIDDLIKQQKEIYFIKHKGETIGFHVQELVGDNHANLILTGCKKGKSELAIPLWHSALLSLKERDIKTVSTLISASNVGVLNLYVFLQFKVKSSLLGMHKIYN